MKYKTLTRNNDFRKAYTRGQSFVSGALVTYVVKTKRGSMRVGITSSKKIGGAVTRNRARRVIRAALRQVVPNPAGISADIVFVARGCTAAKKSTQIEKVMQKHLVSAGILPPGGILPQTGSEQVKEK